MDLSRQPRSSANLADEVQTLLSRLSDPAEDFVQAVHCALHRSACVTLYTKQQTVVYFHTRTLFRVSFNALHYVTISTVCLPVPSVGHWWHRQTGLFIMFRLSLTRLSCAQRTEKRTCSIVPSPCFRRDRQTGHFHCPVMF